MQSPATVWATHLASAFGKLSIDLKQFAVAAGVMPKSVQHWPSLILFGDRKEKALSEAFNQAL
jgi:hypothetical protein